MSSDLRNRPSRKVLSDVEAEISCSQFVMIFLAREATIRKQSLNAHLNYILKLYLNGCLPELCQSDLPIEFIESMLSSHDGVIKINLYRTIYTLLTDQHCDLEACTERGVKSYIVAMLSDTREEAKPARNMAIETLQYLASEQSSIDSQIFDNA